ncbi:MAG TPA: TonB-dependent receptor, partial [Acidobacteriaceae bacterium]
MKVTRGYFSSLMRIAVVAIVALAGTVASRAQAGMGGVSGIVQDSSNAIVPNAKILLESEATGVKRQTVSSGGGLYSFVSVAPGSYTLTVSHDGFESSVQKNITVTVDQTNKINVTLRVGQVNEVVTVDASSSLIDTSNSTVGQLISSQTIDRVPLLTRDVYELVQLSAGVLPANGTANASSTNAIFNARSLIDVSSYTINGSLQGSVYYMLDGSPIGVAENNIATILPAFQVPEDGVEEFRVETQNTPATYASGGGGVISLVSKSGTNKFHGDGFGYFRPSALAANDYFYKQNNPGAGTPDFHRYQEGGAIGGPILRDKLFFFGDYEATQQEQLEVGSATVPTDAEKQGDFSADSFTVYNPFAPDVLGPDGVTMVRQPFEGNMIPSQYWDPVAQNFLKMFPEPNAPGDGGEFHTNNFKSSGLDPQNAHKFDIRVDYAMNEKSKLFGRFSYGRLNFGNADLYGNEYDPYYYVNITNTRNALFGWDYTLNPKTILQLRYSFTRHFENQTGDPRQAGFDITSLGFPQSLADQVLYKQIPTIYLSRTASVGGTGNYDTFIFASENSDATATLTKVLGKHELSFGFEYQKKFMNIGQPPAPAGAYNFDDTATSSTTYQDDSSDFAAFLIGMGSAPGGEGTNFTKDVFAAESNPYYAAFIQDNYHVTPKLTLNLGLRWDIFGSRNERFNRQEYFDPNLAFAVNGVSLTGGEVFATSSNRNPFHTNLKDIGPRAAFTWQPQPHFVLRGGAGIYYGPSAEMVANPAFNTDGFGSSTVWNATAFNDDGNTVLVNPLSNPFPAGVVQPVGSSLGPATNIGAGLGTVLHNNRTTTTYNFNLGFEVELPAKTIFSLAYVGSRGLFLPLGAVDLNTLSLGEIAHYQGSLCVTGGEPDCVTVPNAWASIWPATNQWYGADTVPQWLALEP